MRVNALSRLSGRQRMTIGGAALLAIGVAGGAGAVSITRPTVEMAPTIATPVSALPGKSGIVTVRGRVAAVYGNQFLVQDQTGRTLVDAGRRGANAFVAGSPILVQGRFEDGQLHARYLVDQSGTVQVVGPGHHRDHDRPDGPGGPGGPHGPGGPGGPRGHDGPPPPPPGGPGAPPPPPAGADAPPPPPPPANGGPGAQAPQPGMMPPPPPRGAPPRPANGAAPAPAAPQRPAAQ